MNISGFTTEALDAVQEMLYAEGQVNPLEGECAQKAKRKTQAKPRTPAQEQADQARSQASSRGGNRGNRSEAAKKAAETRKKCKGATASPAVAPTNPSISAP